MGCSIVVHFALMPLTFTNESTKLAMSMYTYQQTLPTYKSCNIYIICIYIYTVIHCNIHTVYRNQPLYTSGQNLNGSPIFTFILQQKTHRFTVIEWRSKDPKCHRPSVEKGGDASLGAFNGCHNLDLPVTVTVANIKFYRDSRRNLNILVVTVYRVGGRSKWSFWLWLN